MRRLLNILALTALLGCNVAPYSPKITVDLSDGIDDKEAKVLIQRYLEDKWVCSWCFEGPIDVGDSWVFMVAKEIPPVADPGTPPIYMKKSTGEITWAAEKKK